MFSPRHSSFVAPQQRLRPIVGFLTSLLAIATTFATPISLPRSVPENEGVSSAAVLRFIEDVDANIDALHSFMLVRHGKVVAEGWWTPHNPQAQHMLFSLSKSFTSTAVGMAIAEGRLSLDTPLIELFPTDAPTEPSGNLRNMRVRDLLAMNTGHHDDDLNAFAWAGRDGTTLVHDFLHLPVAHKPGTHFLYNTPASYVLAAAVEKVSGTSLVDYLTPRLFAPLGIVSPHWDRSKDGVAVGGFGLRATTEDIAKFGQLYLQRGEWNGRRLLPADYVDAATSRQTSNGSNPNSEWDQGYGYQFWRCTPGFYRGDGRFGQFCIVMPQHDAVIAITSGTNDMAGVMKRVWQHILPGLASVPLPADTTAANALTQRLAGLTLRLPAGATDSPTTQRISGRRFVLPDNESRVSAITLNFASDHVTLVADVDGTTHSLEAGLGAWRTGRTAAFQTIENRAMPGSDQSYGAAAAWADANTFTVKISLPETTYTPILSFAFDAEGQLIFAPTIYPLNQGEPFPSVNAVSEN